MRISSKEPDVNKQEIYREFILVHYFNKLDRRFLDKVNKRILKISLEKLGQIDYKELLDFFEKRVREVLSSQFLHILNDPRSRPVIARMRFSLCQSYMIASLILKESMNISTEEAVFKICNDKKYKKCLISNWIDDNVLYGELHPAILMLPLLYLKQLNYKGKIKNKDIYEKVRKDYELYSRWYENFKIVTEEQFNDSNFDLLTCEHKNEASLKKIIKNCPNCGSNNIAYNIKRYEATCNDCGMIMRG